MPAQITLHDVSRTYGPKLVLDGVSVSVSPGSRIGVVGENGAGKSTLLRLLAGQEEPDDGRVVRIAGHGIAHLAQDAAPAPATGTTTGEPASRADTVGGHIDAALAELRGLAARLRAIERVLARPGGAPSLRLLEDYGSAMTAYELRGGFDADARVGEALHGLGLAALDLDRPVATLSGGEFVRLRLACLLAADPEVLLLDEPTDHLDDAATAWLEDHLRGRAGATVAVSHDRVFLDRFAAVLLEVDGDTGTVRRHGNGYAGYLAAHAAERARRVQAHAAWSAEVARLRAYGETTARRVAPGRERRDNNKVGYDRDAGRVQGSVERRVRNTAERLRRLAADPPPAPPAPLRFSGLPASGRAAEGLELTGQGVPGRLAPTWLHLAAGEHVLVTGPNAAGKTTLLGVLAAAVPPGVRVGTLAQELAAARPGKTLLEAYADGRPGHPDEHAEALGALGLFRPESFAVDVAALSTGQRRRLALARLLAEPADVLLLDEPTNHLSPALVEDLEAAWEGYPGTLVVVSHDRRLRERWRARRLTLAGGRVVADRPALACPA